MNIWKQSLAGPDRALRAQTYVKRVFQIKIEVAVEVSAHKLVDLLLRGGVKVLELVHRLELDDVQTVRENAVWFPLEQVLRLVSSDMGDRRENVGAMGCRSLDAVAVVDPALSCFMINIEILQIVVEVDTACAEVAAKECCVSSEDSRDVDVTLA